MKKIIGIFYRTPYTKYNIFVLIYCLLFTNKSFHIYAISTCSTWGVCISFHSSLLLDKTSFYRCAIKKNKSYIRFQIENIIYHIIPCLITINYRPDNINIYHALISILFQLSWTSVITNDTFNLSDIYVYQPLIYWKIMNCIFCITNLSIPLIYQYH